MKSVKWITMCAAVVIFVAANAQSQTLGVTGGLNISNFNGIKGASAKNGLIIGGFMRYNLIQGLAIQPELLFSMKGASVNFAATPPAAIGTTPSRIDWTLNYVEVPILVRLDVFSVPIVPVAIDLYAGPDIAFNVSSNNKTEIDISSAITETSTVDESKNTQPVNFNIAVGGGPHIDLGPMTVGVDVRYTFGTASPFKGLPADSYFHNAKNGTWSIMASVGF